MRAVNLNDILLFAQAVEAGGFAPASRRHGVPKSTLSKRVAALEASLGARLVARNSRSFQLTDLGQEFYRHARAALIEVEAAGQVVLRRQAEPTGTVRLTAAVPVVQFQLAHHLPALAQAYPRLHLDVDATDRFVDVVQEGFDIAVRSHFAPLPDSGLVQRVLAREPILVLASAAYLARRGEPVHPRDLAAHDALLTGADGGRWMLHDANGEQVEARPMGRFTCNESVALLNAAAAGLGLACLPGGIAATYLARGDLVQVLHEWTAGTVTTTALLPHRRGQLPAVQKVLEFLAQRLGGDAEPAAHDVLSFSAAPSRRAARTGRPRR